MDSPPERKWRAVLARDAARDGSFVYAVRTTRIYCRPSCPSRRPRRENVTFYSTWQAAETAGYRACHRCRPRSPTGTIADVCVDAAKRYVDAHLDERVTLERLAKHTGMSPFHLQRAFKARVGLTPKGYLRAQQIEHLKRELKRGQRVTTAAHNAGFGSSASLYRGARPSLGMTPSQYRRGGAGQTIDYAIAETPFGRVLVAATKSGVCATFLAANRRDLVAELHAEFPSASCRENPRAVRSELDCVRAQLTGRTTKRHIHLAISGTPFQKRVWNALRAIPPGETRTYSEVAEQLKAPSAVRAVGNACAQNRLALLVPCHRVLRADGNLGGYRWGIARKRALLKLEKDRHLRNTKS